MPPIRAAQEIDDIRERRNLVGNVVGPEANASANQETTISDFLVAAPLSLPSRPFDAVSCCFMLRRGTLNFAVLFCCLASSVSLKAAMFSVTTRQWAQQKFLLNGNIVM